MPIQFVSGDLFANRFGAEAFAHGCNCQGTMGAGIAVGFKERYPDMYAEYRRRCKADPPEFGLGSVFFWREPGKPAVFNLGTQEKGWHGRATYPAIETALTTMRRLADEAGVTTIAVPRIGAGYGGLSWKKVRAIIERVFADWPEVFYVYEEYHPEAPAEPTP
jgi:O-acetyl-ADP-ribose deacetylase (regulator of RNase III)